MTWSSCLRHDAPFSLQGSVAEVEMVPDFQVVVVNSHMGVSQNRDGPPKWMVYNGKPD